DAEPAHAAGPDGHHPRRRAFARLPGQGRELRRRHGLALRPAAAGKRRRQLRQGRPAHRGPPAPRQGSAGDGAPAPGHVGRAEGTRAMNTAEEGWTGGYNPWTVALVVTMATFMEVLDTSIANVSLPHIAG